MSERKQADPTPTARTRALADELEGLAAAWEAAGHGQRAYVVRGCAADLRALIVGRKEKE